MKTSLAIYFVCLVMSLTCPAEVTVQSTIADVYARGNHENTGILFIRLDDSDFRAASIENPLYLRIRLGEGAKLANTLVWMGEGAQQPTNTPIYLPLQLHGGNGFVEIAALPESMAIVRWIKGEDQIWIRIELSSDFWLEYPGGLTSPSPDLNVSFRLGMTARDSGLDLQEYNSNMPWQSRNAATFAGNYEDAISTLICVDLTSSSLNSADPNRNKLPVDFGLYHRCIGVEDAPTAEEIDTGSFQLIPFPQDVSIGRAINLQPCQTNILGPPVPTRPIVICPQRDPGSPLYTQSRLILEVGCGFDWGFYAGSNLELTIPGNGQKGFRLRRAANDFLINELGDEVDPAGPLPPWLQLEDGGLNIPGFGPGLGATAQLVDDGQGNLFSQRARALYLGPGSSQSQNLVCDTQVYLLPGGEPGDVVLTGQITATNRDSGQDDAPFDGPEQGDECAPSSRQIFQFNWLVGNFSPNILQQPLDVLACPGEPATFEVTTIRVEGNLYQWRKDGIDIAGAVSSQLIVEGVSLQDVGLYTCLVVNECGSELSEAAGLTVTEGCRPEISLEIPSSEDIITVSLRTISFTGTLKYSSDISEVSWANNRGGEGGAGFAEVSRGAPEITYRWSVEGVVLSEGENLLTFNVRAGNGATSVKAVLVKLQISADNKRPRIVDSQSVIPNYGEVGQLLAFRLAAVDDDDEVLEIRWDFGNGNILFGAGVSFAFSQMGLNTFTVTVTDPRGAQISREEDLWVGRANQPPVIVQELSAKPTRVSIGEPVSFAVEAFDPDEDTLTYTWDFGDGSTELALEATIQDYVFTSPGAYVIEVLVSDHQTAPVRSQVLLIVDPLFEPVIGVSSPSFSQFTAAAERAANESLSIFNSGTGYLDYTAELRVVTRPDLNWAQLSGDLAGHLEDPSDEANLVLTFENSDNLQASATGYLAYVDISSPVADPVSVPIRIYVSESPAGKLKTTVVNSGSIYLEWSQALPGPYPDSYEITAVPIGGGVNLSQRTSSLSITVSGLRQNTNYRITVTPLQQETPMLSRSLQTEIETPAAENYGHKSRLPHVADVSQWWTGITVVNPNGLAANIAFEALNSSGEVLGSSPLTRIGPGAKTKALVQTYFSSETLAGASHLRLRSDRGVSTLELFGSNNFEILSGIPTGEFPTYNAYLLVRDGLLANSGISLVGTGDDRALINIDGYSAGGMRLSRTQLSLRPGRKRVSLVRNLFGKNWSTEIKWLHIHAQTSFTGFNLTVNDERSAMGGTALPGIGGLKIALPYVDQTSRVYMLNTADTTNRVEVVFYNNAGLPTSESQYLLLPPRSLKQLNFSQQGSLLFNATKALVVNSDMERIGRGNRAMGDHVLGQSDFGTTFLFPHIATNSYWRTELFLCNTQAKTQELILEARDETGLLLEQKSVILAPHGSLHQQASKLFSLAGEELEKIAYVRLFSDSDARLACHMIFYADPEKEDTPYGAILAGQQVPPLKP